MSGKHASPQTLLFDTIPPDWRGRWQLIRNFCERWFGLSLPEVGEPIPEIPRQHQNVRKGVNPMTGKPYESWEFPNIDRSLCDAWPASAREWFAFVRHLHGFRSKAWPPVDLPDQFFEASTAHEYLGSADELFLMTVECFRGAYVIPKKEWRKLDPPVSFADLTSDSRLESYFPHVTTFAIWYLFECSSIGPNGINDRIRAKTKKRVLRALEDTLPHRTTWDDLQLFERKDVVALVGPLRHADPSQDLLHVLARTSEAVEILRELRSVL